MSGVNVGFIRMRGFGGLGLGCLGLGSILISRDFLGIILRVWWIGVRVGGVVGVVEVVGFRMGLIAFMGGLSVLRVITFG